MSIFRPYCFLQRAEIEAQALTVLDKMAKDAKYGLKFPLDMNLVAEFVGLELLWEEIPSDNGETIAAMILPLEKRIEINEKILNFSEGFIQSTIGHEIGHWILHINQEEVERCQNLIKQGVKVKIKPLHRQNIKALKGREWQAQYLASCLLMPEYILREKSQNKNLGRWRDLYRLAEELGVTISNLIYRLRGLGWISVEGKRIYRLKKCSST
jgi:predicted SprT family Zn-dependent metalloprotease